jgi:hypothetical protein
VYGIHGQSSFIVYSILSVEVDREIGLMGSASLVCIIWYGSRITVDACSTAHGCLTACSRYLSCGIYVLDRRNTYVHARCVPFCVNKLYHSQYDTCVHICAPIFTVVSVVSSSLLWRTMLRSYSLAWVGLVCRWYATSFCLRTSMSTKNLLVNTKH